MFGMNLVSFLHHENQKKERANMTPTQALTLYNRLVHDGFTDAELSALISVCDHDLTEAMEVIRLIREEN
jgi:hypothetical protein